MTDAEYTAYCGLYCLDCIPSNRKFFAIARELQELLAELQFEEYAKLKAESNETFTSYPRFAQVLQEIIALECPGPCRAGGGKTNCSIRACVLSRNYEGCWECDSWEGCELLARLKGIHTNLEYHIGLIRKEGLGNWSAKRRRHYRWQAR